MAAAKTQCLEAKCACGSIHLTFDVPAHLLPLPVYLCHCSICRYATGVPCIFHSVLPEGITPTFIAPSTEKNLTSYQPAQDCTYDFCSTCGCHVAGVSIGSRDSWTIATSMFLNHGSEVFEIQSHVFSNSAPGAAIPIALSELAGRRLTHYNPPEDDPRSKVNVPEAEVGRNGEERLRAQCHCGGVSFTLGRPTPEIRGDAFMSKFVSPREEDKWLASYDMCDDCRLVNGAQIAGWMFVPLSVCDPPIGKDLKIGTAKTYISSEGVLRSFCGTCGATIFYSCDERRPTDRQAVVDVATGILRCPEGAMGEKWLTWRGRLGWLESGIKYDKQLGEALRDGMSKWSMDQYGEVLTLEIG